MHHHEEFRQCPLQSPSLAELPNFNQLRCDTSTGVCAIYCRHPDGGRDPCALLRAERSRRCVWVPACAGKTTGGRGCVANRSVRMKRDAFRHSKRKRLGTGPRLAFPDTWRPMRRGGAPAKTRRAIRDLSRQRIIEASPQPRGERPRINTDVFSGDACMQSRHL